MQCFACGTTNARNPSTGFNQWILNYDSDNNRLCHSCYKRYINRPNNHLHYAAYSKTWRAKNQDKVKARNMKRIRFKDRRQSFKEMIKTGECNVCHKQISKGEIRFTILHHETYHDKDPLKDTIELCPNCHIKRGWQLNQYIKNGLNQKRDYHGRWIKDPE